MPQLSAVVYFVFSDKERLFTTSNFCPHIVFGRYRIYARTSVLSDRSPGLSVGYGASVCNTLTSHCGNCLLARDHHRRSLCLFGGYACASQSLGHFRDRTAA